MFREDYKGQRFGHLTLTGNYRPAILKDKIIAKSECLCDCGSLSWKGFKYLKNGSIRTCSRSCPELIVYSSHGHTRNVDGKPSCSKEYNAWTSIKYSCDNINHTKYRYAGALGITYCEQFNTFEGFLEGMGLAPSEHHRLTRIDKKKNFEPANLEWKLIKRKT